MLVAYLVWDVLSAPPAPATAQDGVRKLASKGDAPRRGSADVQGNAVHGTAGWDATPQARDLRTGVEAAGFGPDGLPLELSGGEPRPDTANPEALSIVGATTRGPVMQSR